MNKQAFTITYTTRLIWEDKFSPPHTFIAHDFIKFFFSKNLNLF